MLPDNRVSTTVKHREDDQLIPANAEVHCERKAARDGASNIAEDNGIALRRDHSVRDGLLDLEDKLLAKAKALFVVPDGCIFKFALRSTPEDDAKRHRPRRDLTEASMAPHVRTRYPGKAYIDDNNIWPNLKAYIGTSGGSARAPRPARPTPRADGCAARSGAGIGHAHPSRSIRALCHRPCRGARTGCHHSKGRSSGCQIRVDARLGLLRHAGRHP